MTEQKLIEAVKKHRVLYDTKHENYMKTKYKNGIWNQLANDLNMKDGEEAKTTWLKLRNSYRDARRRQMKYIRSGIFPENMKLWRFQKQMMFLEHFMSSERPEGNVNDSDDESQLSPAVFMSNENSEGENSRDIHTNEQSINADADDGDNIDESKKKITGTLSQTLLANSKLTKHRKLDDLQSLLKRSLNEQDERTQQGAEETRKVESRGNLTDDPMYNFFISMYQLTRKMPSNYQHRVRNQVFQAVSEAEEEIMNISFPVLQNM